MECLLIPNKYFPFFFLFLPTDQEILWLAVAKKKDVGIFFFYFFFLHFAVLL